MQKQFLISPNGYEYYYKDETNLKSLLILDNENLKYCNNIHNIALFLDTHYPDAFKTNVLTNTRMINQEQWRGELSLSSIHVDLMCTLKFSNKPMLKYLIEQKFKNNSYNPTRDWLFSYKWDEKPRLERFFIDYLGAKNTYRNRKTTYNWFVNVLYRLINPTHKFDKMLILQGPHGCGKTRIFEELFAPMYENLFKYHTRPILFYNIPKSKYDMTNIQKSVIANFDELEPMDSKDVNRIKKIFDKNVGIIIGTSSKSKIFKDEDNDNDKFWIINCSYDTSTTKINKLDRYTIEQIWAEAFYYYRLEHDFNFNLSERERKNSNAEQKDIGTFISSKILSINKINQ